MTSLCKNHSKKLQKRKVIGIIEYSIKIMLFKLRKKYANNKNPVT
jgi:hypothetical protein